MGIEYSRFRHQIKKQVAEKLPGKVATRWEDRIRNRTIAKGEFLPINDAVYIGFNPSYPEEAQLHLHQNLTKDSLHVGSLMLQGFRMFARRLADDASLADIKKVTGYSRIVFDSPAAWRGLGFTVSDSDSSKKSALASMDKDAFIQRFLRK